MDNILEFIQLCYRIVRGWPATTGADSRELKCKRPQTFAFLKSSSDVNEDNLGKDLRYVGKELYYSRLWEASGWNPSKQGHDYPAIFLWNQVFDDNLQNNSTRHTMTLAFCDFMPRKDDTPAVDDVCNQRTLEEVIDDLHNIKQKFFKTLMDCVKAEYELPGPIAKGPEWISESFLQTKYTAAEILSYSSTVPLSSYLVFGEDGAEGVIEYNYAGKELVWMFLTIELDTEPCEFVVTDFFKSDQAEIANQ